MKSWVGSCSGRTRPRLRWSHVWLLCVLLCTPLGCKKPLPKGKLLLLSPVRLDGFSERLMKRWKLKPAVLTKRFQASVKSNRWLHAVPSQRLKPGLHQVLGSLSFLPVPPRYIHKRVLRKGRLFAVARILFRLKTVPNANNVRIEEYALLPYLPNKPPSRKEVRFTLRRVWDKGLRSLGLWAQLSQQPSAALRAVVRNSRTSTAVRHAIVLLGRRRDRLAAPAIIKKLKMNNRFVVRAAVGALTKLRDPRASAPLIKASRGRSIAFQAQILSALGEIGGPQALSHLYTLSTAHPNKTIRQNAKEAYQEIVQREKAAKGRK